MINEKPTKMIVNATTGEQTIEYLTDEEIAQVNADFLAQEERRAIEEAEATALAALKASAKAKLISGQPLTAEEADTLVI
jgi:hypothetical protein